MLEIESVVSCIFWPLGHRPWSGGHAGHPVYMLLDLRIIDSTKTVENNNFY